jgi:hypothetical protein
MQSADPLEQFLQIAYHDAGRLLAGPLGISAEKIANVIDDLHARNLVRPLIDGATGALLALEFAEYFAPDDCRRMEWVAG